MLYSGADAEDRGHSTCPAWGWGARHSGRGRRSKPQAGWDTVSLSHNLWLRPPTIHSRARWLPHLFLTHLPATYLFRFKDAFLPL